MSLTKEKRGIDLGTYVYHGLSSQDVIMLDTDTRRLSDKIALKLKQRITRGEWCPDQKLPSENELSLAYDVSSSTIKKSLYELKREGIVRSHQGKGVFVCTPNMRVKTGLIAVVIMDPIHLQHPVMQMRLSGIESVLTQQKYHMAVFSMKADPDVDNPRRWMGLIDPNMIDGAILMAQQIDLAHAQMLTDSIPVCWCDRHWSVPNGSSVRLDYASGALLAVEHLYELGHRRILLCTKDEPNHHIATSQREGFRMGIQMRELTESKNCFIAVSDYTREAGREAAQKLLERTPRPTALICGSDDIALGMFDVFAERNIRVPEDISLVAWNNTITPDQLPLRPTTIATDFKQSGKLAAQKILAMIDTDPQTANPNIETDYVIPARLIKGQTTCPLAVVKAT